MTYNTASVDNTWIKSPSFATEDLTYICTNNRDYNSDALLIGPSEILSKIVNSLSFTSNINHYQLFVQIQLWIIDVNNLAFEFYMHVNSPDSLNFIYTSADDGAAFVNSPPDYCYKPISSATCKQSAIKQSNTLCNLKFFNFFCKNKQSDFCGGAMYDSLVQISSTFNHIDPIIVLLTSLITKTLNFRYWEEQPIILISQFILLFFLIQLEARFLS